MQSYKQGIANRLAYEVVVTAGLVHVIAVHVAGELRTAYAWARLLTVRT